MNYLLQIWNSKWGMAVCIGLMLGLSFPPVPFPFLIFPAFIFLFRLIDLSKSAREAAFFSYPAFVIWNIIVTYWLTMATTAGGVAAILANSAVMTLPVMLQYYFQRRKFSPWLIAFLQSASWLTYEYLHHQWDLAWPWLTLANAWANVPQLVQYISVTGYWGTSFWILFASALGYQYLKNGRQRTLSIAISAFLLFPVWSFGITLFTSPTERAAIQEAVVVQPNFDSYKPYGGFESTTKATSHLLELTDSVRTPETQLVVWPENAIQADMSNLNSFSDIATDTKIQLSSLANRWDATIISGATFYEYYNGEASPELPYLVGNTPYLPFNAALGFIPNRSMQVYRKHNLVPIVERVPFVQFLNTIDVFNLINWNNNQGYGKGKRANQFPVGQTYTPALICYDSVFPGWIRKYVKNGSGYVTVITNDGWWGNTSGHEQHFAYARLRAIEMDRWVVRSANNGISGIIAPDGSIKVETPYWKSMAFRYDVPVLTSQTFYVRYGDWLPQLMMFCLILGMGYLAWEQIQQSSSERKTRVEQQV